VSVQNNHFGFNHDRRTALALLAGIAVGYLPWSGCSRQSPDETHSGFAAHLTSIFTAIGSGNGTDLRDASDHCARAIISRNRCFIVTDHPVLAAVLAGEAASLPPVFLHLRSAAMTATVRDGDTVIATGPSPTLDAALDNGAALIAIPVSAEPGMPGSAEITIDAHIPATIPNSPDSRDPSMFSGCILTALTGALAAESYHRSGGVGRTGDTPAIYAEFWLDTLRARIDQLSGQHDRIAEAGALIGDCARNGGTLRVYDPTAILHHESAASGHAPTYLAPLTRQELADGIVSSDDVVIIASPRSNEPDDIAVAREAAKAARAVISICPYDGDGGYRLFKEAAVGLDNLSPEREGISGFDHDRRRFLTTWSIMNTALLWHCIEASG
jgi:hypothetical protein